MSSEQKKAKARAAFLSLKRDREFFEHLKLIDHYPHAGQAPILQFLIANKVKNLFLQCSRNFGKSFLLALDAVLTAGRYPRTKYYIIAPFRSQAYEIYWASGLIQRLIPTHWLATGESAVNKSELRCTLNNESFIKFDGADNEDAVRGYKPTRLGCDEFQAWKRETWESMEPNLLAHDATVIHIGTPPDRPNVFTDRAAFVQKRMAERRDGRFVFLKRTIYDNPRYSLEDIEEIRLALMERGEEAIWKREYLAEYIPGGAASIFPMFDHREHARPLEWILPRLNRNKTDFVTISDPSGTRHATLLTAFDRSTASFYVLAEVVETNPRLLTCGQLAPRISLGEKRCYLSDDEPLRIYDEAARLFALEMLDYGMNYSPTQKKINAKSNTISLARDAMIRGKLIIAEDCVNTIRDIYDYHYDENGKIVKKKDDCVDCILYGLAEVGYTLTNAPINTPGEKRRFYTPEEDAKMAKRGDYDIEIDLDHSVDEDFLEESLWQ